MKHCTTCLDNGSLVPTWIAHPVLCQIHASEEMERVLSEATPEEWEEAYKRVCDSRVGYSCTTNKGMK